ncbi:Polyamine transporter RMV1 [Hibiscus syriacus]|uniref:Polyamine transporter RMV1 n=1 Tax=Hibiscus syriacus TaxID=106335 RepID=A0A6A3BRA7_HIBSY|nr:Polyamine transporter RMV1 [Hibiscus syriacus]
MGHYDGAEYVTIGEAPTPTVDNFKKVSVLPLIFLIFYEVSGGPFGVEDSVQAAGPFLALLGFLVFPFIWSIPEALITAEMGTMFPENGVMLFGFHRRSLLGVSARLDEMRFNHCRMGCCASRVFSILPFVVMGLVSIPKLEPSRWFVVDTHHVDWNLYLNTLFWNLNYWDSISTLAGEVDNPKRTLPKALFYALILVVLGYFFPLLGTGALPLDRELWSDGYFSDIAKIIGGVWLRWWIQAAAAMSNMGMFVAERAVTLSNFWEWQTRMLPEFFSKSCRELLVLFRDDFGVHSICKVRMKYPAASRPYKIPLGTVGSILMCIPPTILICVVLALSSLKVAVISLVAVVIGLVMQPGLKYVEKRRWFKFSTSENLHDLNVSGDDDTDHVVR